MKCDRHGESLCALADQELSEKESQRLQEHLAGCPECRAELRVIQGLKVTLRERARFVDPPESFWLGVRARLTQLDRAARQPTRPILFLSPAFAVAGVIVLTLAVGLIIWQSQQRPLATADMLAVPGTAVPVGYDVARFPDEVGFAPRVPPELPRSGARLVGMYPRHVQGRDIASLRYDLGGTPMVVNQTAGPGFSTPELQPTKFHGHVYHCASVDGQNVVVWDDGPIKFMVHGTAPLDRLLIAAEELR